MYIDISYSLSDQIVIYPGNPGFSVERVQDIERGDSANVALISMGSHTGTHIDAPAHFIEGGATLDQIPLEHINGMAKVVDATGKDEINLEFVKAIPIVECDILLLKTDNSFNWDCDRVMDDYVTLTYEAADYLSGSGIKLLGIDYLTVERPRKMRTQGCSVHRSLLGNNVLICEALKLKDVPAGIYEFFCLPLNIKGIDGCPARCVLKSV